MTSDGCSSPSGAPRAFYEDLAGRSLHPHAARGIAYRNLVISHHVPKAARRVLEVGPGEGWLTLLLAARGHEVVAVDLARSWLARLTEPTLRGRATAAMTTLPFAEGSFDVVVAAEVVEHIPDLPGALREAGRVLTPRGTLVLTVPYRETLTYVRCSRCGNRFELNGHVHTFEGTDLARALVAAGLQPERRFVGNTRFSREIIRRLPLAPLRPFLMGLDRLCYRTQRVTDTWLLMTARRPPSS